MTALANLTSGWRARIAGSDARLLPQARLSGPMPWVIAIMVALTVIAAASGLALRNAASAARAGVEGGVTVQVVNADPAERGRQAQEALRLLSGENDVASAHMVPQSELDRLLEPWLGAHVGDEVDALPIPALIDVRMKGVVSAGRLEELRKRLAGASPSARIDAQSEWLAPVFGTIQALQWLAGALIAMLAAATAAAVLLASRNALGANRGTIEVVHMLGGTDAQIARIVQRSMGFDAAAGGLAGLLLGLVALLFLARQFAALESGAVMAGALGWSDWAIVALVPVAGVVLAVVTARITVLRALRRIL
ncbi:MAG: cell division protein [Sphingomonadales bacterium]|nr:cell division protein [Sphingomonadales bacterium]MDE2567993.1 cell division protein [Sphingomonadales bacterium]